MLAVIAAHPRHRVLFALVGGLLFAPLAIGALVAAALAGAVLTAAATRRPGAAIVAAFAVLLGGGVAQQRVLAFEQGVLARMDGRSVAGRVVLLEPLRDRGFGTAAGRVRLQDGPARGEQAVLRLRRTMLHGAAPEVGDVLGVRGWIEPLTRWEAFQHRRGALAAIAADDVQATGARRGGVSGALDGARRRAEAGLDRGLAPPEAALMRGMVLGEDERLSDDVRTDFQRSGLAHILAVSGQNVMLLATLVLFLGALTGLSLRGRLLVALGLVALYVPLTGGGPSIQRAGVMGAAGLAAALAGRGASRWYALGLAAAVTLALNPLTAGEPGWQLSFAAVVALLALGPGLRTVLARRLPAAIADAAAITVAATLGTAPLMALHFEQVSIVSLPANLVAAPAVAPIMWLGMLAAAAAQLSPALAVPFDALAAPLLAFVGAVAHVSARAPLAAVDVHLASPAALAAAYAALGAGCAALLRALGRAGPPAARRPAARRRRRIVAVLALALAGLGVGVAHARGRPAPPPPGELVVSFLDIGQGDATLLQYGGASILVDTGPPDGPILARLAAAGVDRLDVLVLSHAQSDHEGAALAVVRRFSPRLVLDGGAGWPTAVQRGLGPAEARAGGRVVTARAGQSLDLAGLRLRLLWPPPLAPAERPEGDPNERAVVAIASAGPIDVLLTADAESDITLPLALGHVDVLKVAHHGSADEGLPMLLRRLTPSVAAIEVGRHNDYGHPAPSTIAELRGIPVVRTDRDGTVRLHARGPTMTLERLGVGR
ncbi:MAG TPA: ComEC/Rec2 family competence protein [Solirubrobacteraceae bacterium]|nr:ComEC/Rec2 family competence protein [Solirubrobacteraceae bacterium]